MCAALTARRFPFPSSPRRAHGIQRRSRDVNNTSTAGRCDIRGRKSRCSRTSVRRRAFEGQMLAGGASQTTPAAARRPARSMTRSDESRWEAVARTSPYSDGHVQHIAIGTGKSAASRGIRCRSPAVHRWRSQPPPRSVRPVADERAALGTTGSVRMSCAGATRAAPRLAVSSSTICRRDRLRAPSASARTLRPLPRTHRAHLAGLVRDAADHDRNPSAKVLLPQELHAVSCADITRST